MATNNDQKPKIPALTADRAAMQPRPQPRPADKPGAPVNHPAVAEYVTQWNKMAHDVDRLSAENQRLRYELDVAKQRIAELEHISDHERSKKEQFQFWAARFDTMAGEVVARMEEVAGLATTMRTEARRAAEPEPEANQIEGKLDAPPVSPEPERVEQEIAAIAKKFASKTDGSAYPGA